MTIEIVGGVFILVALILLSGHGSRWPRNMTEVDDVLKEIYKDALK